MIYGLILIIIGEIIRINAVRYAGGVTRTTNVGAPSLCTSGPYSRTRNPLYFGNMIIYSGVVLFSGGPLMVPLLCVVLSFFTFQYYMIISLEEETLKELFREEYLEYCKNVPHCLIPWHTLLKRMNVEGYQLVKYHKYRFLIIRHFS